MAALRRRRSRIPSRVDEIVTDVLRDTADRLIASYGRHRRRGASLDQAVRAAALEVAGNTLRAAGIGVAWGSTRGHWAMVGNDTTAKPRPRPRPRPREPSPQDAAELARIAELKRSLS